MKKLTSSCFKGNNIYYRDSDIDERLPNEQEVKKAKKFQYHDLTKEKTFLEVYGDNPETFSLTEIEDLMKRTNKGEDVGLKTDGYANFFPVESNDGVSVVDVRRNGVGQWNVYVLRLGRGARWDVGSRFFSRNPLSLGSSVPSLPNELIINGVTYVKK